PCLERTVGFRGPGDHGDLGRAWVVCSVHGALLWVLHVCCDRAPVIRTARLVGAGGEAPAEVRATRQRATGPGSLLQRVELRRRKGVAFFLGLREPIQIPTAGGVICLRTASFYCGAS